jgi:hypothetical protein
MHPPCVHLTPKLRRWHIAPGSPWTPYHGGPRETTTHPVEDGQQDVVATAAPIGTGDLVDYERVAVVECLYPQVEQFEPM